MKQTHELAVLLDSWGTNQDEFWDEGHTRANVKSYGYLYDLPEDADKYLKMALANTVIKKISDLSESSYCASWYVLIDEELWVDVFIKPQFFTELDNPMQNPMKRLRETMKIFWNRVGWVIYDEDIYVPKVVTQEEYLEMKKEKLREWYAEILPIALA